MMLKRCLASWVWVVLVATVCMASDDAAPTTGESPKTSAADSGTQQESAAPPVSTDTPSSEASDDKEVSPEPKTQPQVDTKSEEDQDSLDSLRREANGLLEQYQTSRTEDRPGVAKQLRRLARRFESLADRSADTQEQVEAGVAALQVYDTLATTAPDAAARKKWVGRLKSAARKARQAEGGEAVAEFWSLKADLLELNLDEASVRSRCRQMIARLERFALAVAPVAGSGQTGVASMLHAARVGLLSLYDQCGMSRRAGRLLTEMRASASRGGLFVPAEIEKRFEYASLLGQRYEMKLVADSGAVWTSEGHRGFVTLLHFFADWAPPSTQAMDELSSRYVELVGRGVSILSVKVNGTGGTTPSKLQWPTYTQRAGQPDLVELFKVRSLPRFVVIDAEGRVAAAGATLEVLDEVMQAASGATTEPAVVPPGDAGDKPSQAVEPPADEGKKPGDEKTAP